MTAVSLAFVVLVVGLLIRDRAPERATDPTGADRSGASDSDRPVGEPRTGDNPIARENALDGSTDWQLTGKRDGGIAGFAVPLTVARGETVTLYVSTSAPRWRVDVYRIGWYGGDGGRLVWSSARLRGVEQPPPIVTPPIENMVETRWEPNLDLPAGEDWTTGVYLAKLRSSRGSESYVPFIVRDDRPADLYFQSAVTTWLAYNAYGGKNVYADVEGEDEGVWDARSRMVSLDRPFRRNIGHGFRGDPHANSGAENFLQFEVNLLRFLEREGYDVTYGSNLETHARPELLLQSNAVLVVGHDEYWTKEMFDHLELARDSGVNLAFLGANIGYRAVRLEDSPLGPLRRMVHYKAHEEDPLLGKDDERVAAQWRYGPTDRPENSLIGIMYACDPVHADWVAGQTSHWLYRGAGFSPGDAVPHLVGHEYDRLFTGGAFARFTPEGVEVLAESPVVCQDDEDVAHTTLYVAPSGAGVFAAGTINWGWGVDDWGVGIGDPRIERFTRNLLDAFAPGPLGAQEFG
ncbi:MAG: hypothetical protein HY658_04285 [Actinobacteria bacterium]|nr:hypothetical protein [Actinomycetota bacterium]